MKPYGIPRTLDIVYPDVADRNRYGVKGGRMKNRRAKRRIWKKLERRVARFNINHID